MELRSVPAFLSADECALLIHLANQKGMTRSRVVRYEDDVSCERRSETAWLASHDHPFLAVLFERAHELTGMQWSEELQVVRYEPGGYFRPHYDQCYKESDACVRRNPALRRTAPPLHAACLPQRAGDDASSSLASRA